MKQITKTYNRAGKWIEKKTLAEVLLCQCGNKYLKTRPGQKVCLRCVSAATIRSR